MKFIKYLIVIYMLSFSNAFALVEPNNAIIPISVIPTKGADLNNNVSTKEIVNIVRKTFLKHNINILKSGGYARLNVQPMTTNKGGKYLLIFMPHKLTFSLDIARINIDANNKAYTILRNYKLTKADFANEQHDWRDQQATCPDNSVQFVAMSFEKWNPNVIKATDDIYQAAQKQGLDAKELTGDDATWENFENYLVCPNLKGLSSIGHGGPNVLEFSDGFIQAKSIQDVIDKVDLPHSRAVFLDSCQVFQDPMKTVFIKSTPEKTSNPIQWFSGGVSSLNIWGSAETYSCMWQTVLSAPAATTFHDALLSCEKQYDPTAPGNTSPVYVVNTSTVNAVCVKVNQPNKQPSVLIDQLDSAKNSSVMLNLDGGDSISEIYEPVKNTEDCATADTDNDKKEFTGFSKAMNLHGEEYPIIEDSSGDDELLVTDQTHGNIDEYGDGGNGSQYFGHLGN